MEGCESGSVFHSGTRGWRSRLPRQYRNPWFGLGVGPAKKVRGGFVDVRFGELMEDILWLAVTIAFFALSIGYVRFCERLK